MTIAEAAYRAWSAWKTREPGHEDEWKQKHEADWPLAMQITNARAKRG